MTLTLKTAVLTMVLAAGAASLSAADEPKGSLTIMKNCSQYNGNAGDFCTITDSSLPVIPKGAKLYVIQPFLTSLAFLDSNVVLDSGNGNRAVGRCTLDVNTNLGLCTFSDGTGNLAGFSARVNVYSPTGVNFGIDYVWQGTYSFQPISQK
jgi:hypothetical protein